MTRELSIDHARRIALGAQGFNDPRPSGRVDIRHLRRVLRRVGLFQIDSVNVLVRAHYMPLFSRLGPYPRELLDDAVYRRREVLETWLHEACLAPTERWPLIRSQMEEGLPWNAQWARANNDYIIVHKPWLRCLSESDLVIMSPYDSCLLYTSPSPRD